MLPKPSSLLSPAALTEAVVVLASVDAADKVLLPATFKALEVDLGVGPAQLGQLSYPIQFDFAYICAYGTPPVISSSQLRLECDSGLLIVALAMHLELFTHNMF